MFYQNPLRSIALLALVIGLALYAIFGGFFAREIVIEIAILAILAISLDLVAGFGGMISLCHGAILGIAAYGYSVLTAKFGYHPIPAALFGITLAMLFSAGVAAIISRTSGIFFIMATLAFGQMVYSLVFKSQWLGGDDGMSGVPRFDFSWLGIDFDDSLQFALFGIVCIVITYLLAALILRSSFGRTLCGIHGNETRMRALGVNTSIHKTITFTLSSALAAIAGILAAQHTQYISPELLFWTVSGEVMIIVILGGLGTLVGPAIGAALFVLIKHQVSDYTNYWHIIVGIVLIMTVMAGRRGFYGQFEHWVQSRKKRDAGTNNA